MPFVRSLLIVVVLLSGTAGLAAQLVHNFPTLARTQVQYLAEQIPDLQLATPYRSSHLTTTSGSPVRLGALRQALVNLPAITRANWRMDTSGRDTVINWTVEESRTVFPLLSFGGVRGNTFYQLGFNDIHFRGRGQQLTAFYLNNVGRHNLYLAFRNAHLRGSRWGYAVEARRFASVEPLYFPAAAVSYDYENLSVSLGSSFTFRPGLVLRFGLSPFRERYRKLRSEDENSPGPAAVEQFKLLLKSSLQRNRVNYFFERSAGTHHRTTVQYVHNFADRTDFLIGWHDFRYYRLLGSSGNVAGRLRAGVSGNQNSPFAPFVLDSQVNIRGSGNRIDRGTAQLILNLEYRHSVWRDRRERFAAQVVAFSDLGTWRNPGGRFTDLWEAENFRHFIGGGVRLISLKAHNAVLRLDYGVDVRSTRERGVVAGFGQYF